MRYFPAFLDLQGRSAVVIGGGRIAERKVLTLLACGARVTVVSPGLTPKLSYLVQAGAIRGHARRWRPVDLKEAFLIMATTDDRKANAEIARRAQADSRLVNIADDPARCNVIMPSVITRGDLIIAVSTSGKSPSLARRIRRELEGSFGAEYGKFICLLGSIRKQVQSRVPSMARRRRILQRLAASDLLTLLRQGKKRQVQKRIQQIVGLKDLTLNGY
ncbi:MAG TPA: bifunctional precorrin-2 dehydrogenase/sirohydrochlorin ferrochelatase [Nitrospiria bacterium]|jgi:precorrin-2 dehydrogenase/sirohydrochlorin ferrochelatase|nr:bifunctional precorrin-2 dehydrogenase/sirohydrochlorin ferrochelatase [Nitrospiria bacterium]